MVSPFDDIPGLTQLGDLKVVKGGFVLGEVGREERLINFVGNKKTSETFSVNFAVYISGRPQIAVGATNATVGGVGYIEFATGGAPQSRIEFDLPLPRPRGGPNLAGGGSSLMPNREQIPNVIVVTVSGAAIVAGARLDSAVRLIHDPLTPIGAFNVVPTFPGPPPPPPPPVVPPVTDADLTISLRVGAWLSRFPSGGVQGVKLRRTGFITNANGAAFAVNDAVTVIVPQLARRVRFPRFPITEPLEVTINGSSTVSGIFTVPAGSVGPLEVHNDAFSMLVRNVGANPITTIAAEFELEI